MATCLAPFWGSTPWKRQNIFVDLPGRLQFSLGIPVLIPRSRRAVWKRPSRPRAKSYPDSHPSYYRTPSNVSSYLLFQIKRSVYKGVTVLVILNNKHTAVDACGASKFHSKVLNLSDHFMIVWANTEYRLLGLSEIPGFVEEGDVGVFSSYWRWS